MPVAVELLSHSDEHELAGTALRSVRWSQCIMRTASALPRLADVSG